MHDADIKCKCATNDIYLVWIHVKKCLSAAEVIIGGAWHLLNMPDGTSLTFLGYEDNQNL